MPHLLVVLLLLLTAGSARATIDLGDAENVVRGMMEDARTKIDWMLPRELLPKNRVKLLLNLALLAGTTIPRGGLIKVDAAPGVINITFKKDAPIDPMGVIALIQKNRHIKLVGNEKLRIERELKEPKDRAQLVRDILRGLGQPLAQPALG